jgi:hypothetical protein
MAKVAVASAAGDLGSDHQVAGVAVFLNRFRIDRASESRPSATGVILVAGGKKLAAACGADVGALLVKTVVFA